MKRRSLKLLPGWTLGICLALLQLCCPASSLAATVAVALGCPRRFGQFGVGGGSPTFSSATRQPASAEGENVVLEGRPSLHELPNMATHREKLRAIHAADDITDDGCQYACRS